MAERETQDGNTNIYSFVTETNANELDNIKVTLFKNDKTIALKDGKDLKPPFKNLPEFINNI